MGRYGEACMVLTNDEELFYIMDTLRVYERAVKCERVRKPFDRDAIYLNMRICMNSSLEGIQFSVPLDRNSTS